MYINRAANKIIYIQSSYPKLCNSISQPHINGHSYSNIVPYYSFLNQIIYKKIIHFNYHNELFVLGGLINYCLTSGKKLLLYKQYGRALSLFNFLIGRCFRNDITLISDSIKLTLLFRIKSFQTNDDNLNPLVEL